MRVPRHLLDVEVLGQQPVTPPQPMEVGVQPRGRVQVAGLHQRRGEERHQRVHVMIRHMPVGHVDVEEPAVAGLHVHTHGLARVGPHAPVVLLAGQHVQLQQVLVEAVGARADAALQVPPRTSVDVDEAAEKPERAPARPQCLKRVCSGRLRATRQL